VRVPPQVWASRAVWLVIAVAAIWVVYIGVSHYGSCRTDGVGKLVCLGIAVCVSCIEVALFIVVTTVKLLVLILP
jgi:hypothetical protein